MLKELEGATVNEVLGYDEFTRNQAGPAKLDANWLRSLCIEAGADDVGFVEIDRREIEDQRKDILSAFPGAKTVVCLAHRINSDSVRAPVKTFKNIEFKYISNQLLEIPRKILRELRNEEVRGVIENGSFPMDAGAWPGKLWTVSLKPLAIAAGFGRMGFNRLVIHPEFGSFMNISAILIDKEMTDYSRPVDDNPCLDCKLCVAACPTGAIANDGQFAFSSCITHNYREKLGGFSDWIEQISQSRNSKDYRKRVSDKETVSMWQSLSFGANSKCDNCMAVCPGGKETLKHYNNLKDFANAVVKPLQKKNETVYVVPKSDAETHVTQKFPHKTAKRVGNGIRPDSVNTFLVTLPLVFQRLKSDALNATFHFTFTGNEERKATIAIRNKSITVKDGHIGKPDLRVNADSHTWIGFIAKERNIVWALLTRKIRLKGPISLLSAFGKCFPS